MQILTLGLGWGLRLRISNKLQVRPRVHICHFFSVRGLFFKALGVE